MNIIPSMIQVIFLVLFALLSSLRASENLEAWSTFVFQYAPISAPLQSATTISNGSLIAQLGLSGGGIICVGDAHDRMAAWSFKHRAYAPIAGVPSTETDLSGILKMEVLGYSEVGSVRPLLDTPPKRAQRLGWVTSNRTVKVIFKPTADCESELWGVMRVNYTVTQHAGSLEASWVPSGVSLKLGGVWTPSGGGTAGSAGMLLTMGAFKRGTSDSIEVPISQVKVAGQSAVLNGNITGTEGMSYQWFKDGVVVVGGTSAGLVIPALGSVHAGNYRVEARDGFGSVQQSYVTLTVLGFTQQPQDVSVVAGEPITLSAQAQGGELPVSYQWYKGALLVAGATGSNLSIASATLANAGTYSVKVSAGGATLTSNSVQVFVKDNTDGWQLFVGASGGPGHSDGIGTNARFNRPAGVAVDRNGNAYVADAVNTTIRKITPSGVVSTLAGAPTREGYYRDGQGSAARFLYPEGIAVDLDGNVYVADRAKIRKVSPSGQVTTLAGSETEGSTDGSGSTAKFNRPLGLCVDAMKNIYVADTGNQTIRKISASGAVTTIAGKPGVHGYRNGPAAESIFDRPQGIATDASGNVYVAEGSGVIRKISTDKTVSKFAGEINSWMVGGGEYDGLNEQYFPRSELQYYSPRGICVDSGGNLYVASSGVLRKISSAGVVTTLKTYEPSDFFFQPTTIAVDANGAVYAASDFSHNVYKIEHDGTSRIFAGGNYLTGITDGLGASARFSHPIGMAVSSSGSLFIGGNTLRQVTAEGVVKSLPSYGSVGRLAAVDSALNLYAIGFSCVEMINPNGMRTIVAGSAELTGSVDGPATNARFNYVSGLAVGPNNTLTVTDFSNHTVRRISATGIVSTLAGLSGVSGSTNGVGSSARFNMPSGIVADSLGNLFVADSGSARVRKITAGGAVTTLAGSGSWGVQDGPGTTAKFTFPTRPTLDAGGSVYVIEGTGSIRKITTLGVVSTLDNGGQFIPTDISVFGKYLYALTEVGVWRMFLK